MRPIHRRDAEKRRRVRSQCGDVSVFTPARPVRAAIVWPSAIEAVKKSLLVATAAVPLDVPKAAIFHSPSRRRLSCVAASELNSSRASGSRHYHLSGPAEGALRTESGCRARPFLLDARLRVK